MKKSTEAFDARVHALERTNGNTASRDDDWSNRLPA